MACRFSAPRDNRNVILAIEHGANVFGLQLHTCHVGLIRFEESGNDNETVCNCVHLTRPVA